LVDARGNFVDEQDLTPYPCRAVFVDENLNSRGDTFFDRHRFGYTIF
jgi:hypothetical protein